MKISFKQKMKLKKIVKNNKGKIALRRGPEGHFWFDTNLDLEELDLPQDFKYVQRLYDDNGGGQYSILDGEENLGRINVNK